jgi:hypothetical protein
MADSRKRWDTDDRFTGVADASAFAPAVEELAALALYRFKTHRRVSDLRIHEINYAAR